MIESPVGLPRLLKARGRATSRQKYQRPEVYATGKRERLWKGEWRDYYLDAEGKEQSRHRSKTWRRANFTKAEAQAELDALLREEQQGGPKRDGSMTLATFWETYCRIKASRWTLNTRTQSGYLWENFIKPAMGAKPLNEITKATIELALIELAEADRGKGVLEAVKNRIHSIFEEALDNDYVQKNRVRKVELPVCRADRETRSMTDAKVQRLWDKSYGRDYVMWRTLLLTGARISELLALERTDLLPEGLRIDESGLLGRPSTTKNKKTRVAPIPASLREELEEWLTTHPHRLFFPSATGKMHRYDDRQMRGVQRRTRTAAEIPDLTFRMCRTTFATLFEGDIADVQASLGHHSVFTLQRYRKSISARHQAAVEELDRRLKVVPITKESA